MKYKTGYLLILAFLFWGQFGYGQTLSDMKAKYGQPQMTFVVGKRVWMTPDFAVDGTVCRMTFFPQKADSGVLIINPSLNPFEIVDVLDKVVTQEMRGNYKTVYVNTSMMRGFTWKSFNFGDVKMVFNISGSTGPSIKTNGVKEIVLSDDWKPRSIEETLARNTIKIEDLNMKERLKYSIIDSVQVEWKRRTCAE